MVGIRMIMEAEEEEEKWVVNGNYSSTHEILLVGEGDFSFALSLALSFASASNILATSLDSLDALTKKYKKAKSNLELLVKLGASLLHGVDATKMKLHTDLKMRRFDRIIYNFPHAGFHGKEDNLHLIKKHRGLVHGFFHSASGLLRPDGEVHVSHKTSAPFSLWNLKELASQNSLLLIECAPFRIKDYPGYNNKRGDGSRCDEPFRLGECSTFKFILMCGCKKSNADQSPRNTRTELVLQLHRIPPQNNHNSDAFALSYPDLGFNSNLGSGLVAIPVSNRFKEDCIWIFNRYFRHVAETFGLPDGRIHYNVHKAICRGYGRFVDMASSRPSSDFILFLEEIHRLSVSRIEWLEGILACMR